MDTKKMFEEYWENKAKIVLCENLIENRKMDMLPSMTQTLSHAPKGTGNESGVERSVIDRMEAICFFLIQILWKKPKLL